MRRLNSASPKSSEPVGELHRAVGRNIRARRRALVMTLETLEERCGVGAAFIGQIERTDKRGSVQTLARIAAGLSVPLSQLLRSDGTGAGPRDGSPWLAALLRPHGERERVLLYDTLRLLSRRVRSLDLEER